MTLLIEQAIGLSILLAGVLTAAAALRRRSAALRHWIIAAGVISSLALPIARTLVPTWSVVPLPISIQGMSATVANGPSPAAAGGRSGLRGSGHRAAPARPSTSVGELLAGIWTLGAAAYLLAMLAGISRLAWHAHYGRLLDDGPWKRAVDRLRPDAGIRRPVAVRQTSSSFLLGAWGWRTPVVLVPRGAEDWPETDIDLVMRHELAHIARADWAIQFSADLLRALHWFNPLTWLACSRLRAESEQACDNEVLRAGVEAGAYAMCLVHLAALLRVGRRRWTAYPAPAMARSTSLQRRVTAMLNPGLIRSALSARSRAFIVVLALASTVPVAGLAVRAQAPAGFSGLVLDQTGKSVANARIVLTEIRNGVQHQTKHEIKSDARGRFEFTGLPAGNYEMEVSLPGFATVQGTITVAPQGGASRDIRLELSSVRETLTVRAGTSTPPAAPRAPRQPEVASSGGQPPCVAGEMGGNVRPPMKLVDVKPEYPPALIAQKVTGQVVVEGTLASDGTVRDMRIVTTPEPELGRVVVDAVGKWRFTPTLLNCEPADINIKINVTFELE